jgi:predicted Fe-Mo cluster-binding NifX family protein
MALERAGIKVAQNLENMNIKQAIDHFQKGDLAWAEAPNRRGHGR